MAKLNALRYHGGKWMLTPWIISHFPAHRCYVESFGGAAGVLLKKSRSYAEIYNDLDGGIVNFFKVIRNPVTRSQLIESLSLTPYVRNEFYLAYESGDEAIDSIEQARRLKESDCLLVTTEDFNRVIEARNSGIAFDFIGGELVFYGSPPNEWSSLINGEWVEDLEKKLLIVRARNEVKRDELMAKARDALIVVSTDIMMGGQDGEDDTEQKKSE